MQCRRTSRIAPFDRSLEKLDVGAASALSQAAVDLGDAAGARYRHPRITQWVEGRCTAQRAYAGRSPRATSRTVRPAVGAGYDLHERIATSGGEDRCRPRTADFDADSLPTSCR